MNLDQAIKYHLLYPLYLKNRFKNNLTVKNINDFYQNKIKFRIFDRFTSYQHKTIGENNLYIIINKENFNKVNLIDKIIFSSFDGDKYIYFYLKDESDGFIMPIVGKYVYDGVLTLCSYPTIETLKKSIQLNPGITKLKLQSCYDLTKEQAIQVVDFIKEL